ncbi:MAG TPA: hypothetical protein P5038_08095 [Candidatus Paceibacterota bacterium]|nr:hypothetical protein [Candidatus Paceibacterota bacterium]
MKETDNGHQARQMTVGVQEMDKSPFSALTEAGKVVTKLAYTKKESVFRERYLIWSAGRTGSGSLCSGKTV